MYVDDMVIFSNGSSKAIMEILAVIHKYESWSGQCINLSKSAIYYSQKIPSTRKSLLLRMTGFSEGSFPFKYLGVPIILGRLKQVHLEDTVFNIQKKISGWKMRFLSVGGRLILLRHVLSSMALHLFVVLQVP